MFRYCTFLEVQNLKEIQNLWNEEVGYAYPISESIFMQNVINCQYLSKEASFAAYDHNELVGFVISKVWNDDERIPNYYDLSWINLFYVKRKYRRKGIGSQLLLFAETKLKQMGKKEIHLGKDIHNFFPGIPVDFNYITPNWFEKRGFEIGKCTHDLICKDFDKSKLQLNNANKFIFRFATIEDKDKLLQFFQKNFPGRWLYECLEYYRIGQFHDDYLIVLDKENVIAFCRCSDQRTKPFPYHLTWYTRFEKLGALGPLGVDKDYRKLSLGGDIVKAGILSLLSRGQKEILIDWTSLLEFYGKYGFEVWKSYSYASKLL